MKIRLSVILICLYLSNLSAQELKVQAEFEGIYHKLNSLEIKLDSDKISITENNLPIYAEEITGKKVFKPSESENFFLISSYQFPEQKSDYPIEVRIFDNSGMLILPLRFTAPYDLPHPLLDINDNGILASFDPLTYKVKLIGEEIYKEIKLEKDVPFEMEKSAYLQMNEDLLYILTSHQALDITEEANNVSLYRINISDLSIEQRKIDYNTPTTLKLIGGYLFASGVRFENLQPLGRTIKYNLNLEEIAVNDMIIEKIVSHNNRFFGKYFNKIFELDNNLKVIRELSFAAGERVVDLTAWNDKLFAATHNSGENFLYQLSFDLNIEFKQSLNIFKMKNLDFIRWSENTLIINHDSKSTLLQLNEN